MSNNRVSSVRTAEYARRGHPDRTCDIIADAILDEYIINDPLSRVAIEVFGCHGTIYIGGEVSSKATVDIGGVVKLTYKKIGYLDEVKVIINIIEQSPEIHHLADLGAGDSGIVTGYATRETRERLPLEVVLAKRIADEIDDSKIEGLMPDGKIQVTTQNGKAIDVIVAYQTLDDKNVSGIRNIVMKILGEDNPKENERLYVEKMSLRIIPFFIGGFNADTGLTGRKNALWYGPSIPIGGGSFAGKDATKVDRSGAYLARAIALRFLQVDSELKDCFVEISYMIGCPRPIYVKVNGIVYWGKGNSSLTVSETINKYKLRKPTYELASLLGHFGNKNLSWEK